MLNHIKEIARLRDNAGFIAYEYLTWLFLLLDRPNAEEEVRAITKDKIFKEDVKVVLGNRLVSCLLHHKEQKTSVVSPLLEESHEIFASFRNGHVVESMALSIGFGDYSVSLQLNASDFSLSQVKLKNNYEDKDFFSEQEEEKLSEQDKTRENIFLRMSALRDVEKVLDALFGEFLQIRTTNYSEAIAAMRKHIDSRLAGALKKENGTLEQLEEVRYEAMH